MSAREKAEMDAKEFHRGYNWRMVSGNPTGSPSTGPSGSDCSPRSRILDVNDICLEPDDFVTTQRLIDKSVAAAEDSCSESDEMPSPTQTNSVAKLFLLLLASLTVAIIVPQLLPSGYSGLQFFSFAGDSSKFNAPAGSGDWLDERSLTSQAVGGPIDPALRLVGGASEDVRPAAQNCLPIGPRSALEPGSPPAEHGPSAPPPVSPLGSGTLISRRLQEIEFRLRECELILQLLDSGKGAFSGFAPENNITGISSLARFQEKIVQLEINKQALAVRFAPTSKEIQSIELEIQGVKTAMRECVEANLRFFQKGREQLLGGKASSERKKGPTVLNDKRHQPQSSEPSLLGRCWSFVSDGIDAVINQLISTGKSVASRAAKFGNRLIAYASTRTDRDPGVGKRENDWSRLAGSGHSKHPETRINTGRAERARDASPSNRNRHRVVNAAPSPEPGAGIADPTGARRRLWQSLRDNDNSCVRQ